MKEILTVDNVSDLRILALEEIGDCCISYALMKHLTKIIRKTERVILQSYQLREVSRDAERYRWLRENIQPDYNLPGEYYLCDEDTSTWDGTIDAAMENSR